MTGYFEDIRIGEQTPLGSHLFTAEEIVHYARRFDPQPFHIDEEAAKASHFGGLIASGWHTASVWMRLMVAHWQQADTAGGSVPGEHHARIGPSPGLRELKWLAPVFAGDSVSYSTRVTEKVELAARPNWGLVISRNEGLNHRGEPVLSFLGEVYVERRSAMRAPG